MEYDGTEYNQEYHQGQLSFDLDLYNREENQCKMGDYECEKCFTPLKHSEYFGSIPCIICGHENCELPF